LENPDVNPETGQRIQRDGPTYKKLEGLGCSEFEEELEEFQEKLEQKQNQM